MLSYETRCLKMFKFRAKNSQYYTCWFAWNFKTLEINVVRFAYNVVKSRLFDWLSNSVYFSRDFAKVVAVAELPLGLCHCLASRVARSSERVCNNPAREVLFLNCLKRTRRKKEREQCDGMKEDCPAQAKNVHTVYCSFLLGIHEWFEAFWLKITHCSIQILPVLIICT